MPSAPPSNFRQSLPMATSQVILRTKIKNLGAEADIVTVKAGFARNYLVPQGKAYFATEENKSNLEELEKARAKREVEELQDAEKLAGKIKKLKPSFVLETGQGGKAFGSITSMDIQKKLEENQIEVDRTAIDLDKPIKTTGRQSVTLKLHPDVSVDLHFNVEGSEEKAAAEAAEAAAEAE